MLLLGAPRDVQFISQTNPNRQHTNSISITAASERGHVEVVKRLLQAGAEIDAGAGWRNQTALQSAGICGQDEVVTALVNAGASGNATGGVILFDG